MDFDGFEISSEALKLLTAVAACILVSGMFTVAGDGSDTARTEASDVGLGFDDFEISSEALKLFTADACMLVSGMSTAAGEGSKIRARAPDKG